MEPSNNPSAISDLISVYVADYNNIREEIRMRIAQRHQFTSFSLVLFSAIITLLGALLIPKSTGSTLNFLSLPTEYVIALLFSPWIFYALCLSYLRHDYYIIYMTIYLEIFVGRKIREVAKRADASNLDLTDLLGWEKYIQEVRQKEKSIKTFTFIATISDILSKHAPFLVPIIILLGLSSSNILRRTYDSIVYVLWISTIVGFIIIVLYSYFYYKKLMKARFIGILGDPS